MASSWHVKSTRRLPTRSVYLHFDFSRLFCKSPLFLLKFQVKKRGKVLADFSSPPPFLLPALSAEYNQSSFRLIFHFESMCVQMFLRKGQVLLLFNYGAPPGVQGPLHHQRGGSFHQWVVNKKKAKHGLHFERRKTLSRTGRLFRVHMFGVAQEENNPIRQQHTRGRFH